MHVSNLRFLGNNALSRTQTVNSTQSSSIGDIDLSYEQFQRHYPQEAWGVAATRKQYGEVLQIFKELTAEAYISLTRSPNREVKEIIENLGKHGSSFVASEHFLHALSNEVRRIVKPDKANSVITADSTYREIEFMFQKQFLQSPNRTYNIAEFFEGFKSS